MEKHLFEIVEEPIQIEKVIAKVVRREAGAITTFIGTVREWTKGRRTLYLKYEAYVSMAEKMLRQVGEEVCGKWPDVKIAITHRIGELQISDTAVVVAVSAPHRKEAYAANEYAMERIKQIVPIWKKEHWEDGEMWIGNQSETVSYAEGKPIIKGGKH